MSLKLGEARDRARVVTVHSYDVDLDVTSEEAFRSTATIRFSCTSESTFAEFVGALEVAATLDGQPLPAEAYAGGRIHLEGLSGTGEHVLKVEATAHYTTSGEGMHTFTDPADGERYVSAYTGMDMASRVFCCFDQPDLKAPITLTVTADPGWTVLGNGVRIPEETTAERAMPAGRETTAERAMPARGARRSTFTTTPPISPLLFVMCAGPWASRTWEHAGIPFGWHARASLGPQLDRDIDEIRRITEACFDHYTTTFTPPYAFDSYDQVFVPGLNWGAMEEPGCVTFREEYLPEAEPTAEQRMARATVIAHEMAHMWFGDLATMRWWQDSWLNESFADYMGYQVAARAGFDGAWVDFALERKPTSYVADARRSTHPIAATAEEVGDVETALGNFDMITYAKGAAVLRQLVTWLGEDDFLAGVNAYLERYAFANADLADFLDCLSERTDRDVRGWAADWLSTTGYDEIAVDQGPVPVVRRTGTRAHRFTVGGYDGAGVLARSEVIDLADDAVELSGFAGLTVLPDVHEETYAARIFDEAGWRFVGDRLGDIDDPLTRAMLWSAAVQRTRDGLLPVAGLLDLAARHLPGETDPLIVEHVLRRLLTVVRTWSTVAGLDDAQLRLNTIARGLLTGPAPIAAAESTLATAVEPADVRGWLDAGALHGVALPQDLRWIAVQRLAELGDPTAIAAEEAQDRREAGRLAALRATASAPSYAAKEEAWSRMNADGTSNREYAALSEGLWRPGQHELVEPFFDRYLDRSPALAAVRGPGFAQVVGRAFPTLPLPSATAAALRDGTRQRLVRDDVPTVLRRSWSDRLDDLDIAIRVREAAGAD